MVDSLAQHMRKEGGIWHQTRRRAAGEMKRTLSLTGVTVNAMALIAPGAFLWTTLQAQAALQNGGRTTAMDMMGGLFAALILAF